MKKIIIVFVVFFSFNLFFFYYKSHKINKGFKKLELLYGKMSFMDYHCDCFSDSPRLELDNQTIIDYYEFDSLDSYVFKLQISDPFDNDTTFRVYKMKNDNDTLLLFVSSGFDGKINFHGKEFIKIEDINNKNFYNSLNYYRTSEDFTIDKNNYFFESLIGEKDYIIGLIDCKKYIIVR